MEVSHTIHEVRASVAAARKLGKVIGLVPTMGALHEGHASLVDVARKRCGFVVVSVFVNPTQFGPQEDFSRYPRTLEADCALCETHGADLVFAPSVEEMYPRGMGVGIGSRVFDPAAAAGQRLAAQIASVPAVGCSTSNSAERQATSPQQGEMHRRPSSLAEVTIKELGDYLCGASRPGHFTGVCTVVSKLFNIVLPDQAFFGAKDYQQATIIRRMTRDLNFPVEVVVCPTVRESDGLAMSSRNRYLSPEHRKQALALSGALKLAKAMIESSHPPAGEVVRAIEGHIATAAPDGAVDYIAVADPERLSPVQETHRPVLVALAVKFGATRLIDNIVVDSAAARS